MTWPWPDIPAPPFGLDEQPGAPTQDRAASVTGNLTLPAGAVLRLLPGVHNISGRTWTLNGTASAPVFVIAEPGAVLDCLGASQLTINGTYAVLVELELFRARIRSGAQQLTLRGCEVHGWSGTGSTVIVGLTNGSRNFLADGCHIHTNGPQTTAEADIHAHKASAAADVTDLWIVRGHYHGNSGDSVQLGSATGTDSVRRAYIVGNDMHDEGENGVDLKLCRDVLVAHNLIRNMRAGLSDPGRGVIIHDDAVNPTVRNNEITDCDAEGIVSTGSSGLLVHDNTVRRCGTGIRAYSSTGTIHSNRAFACATPYNFSGAVVQYDNLVDPPEGAGPTPITNLTITLGATMQANISWQGGDGAESKRVERSSGGGNFAELATLPGNATSYEDATITAGTHTYRISAVSILGTSSAEAIVGPPTAFTALTITVVP